MKEQKNSYNPSTREVATAVVKDFVGNQVPAFFDGVKAGFYMPLFIPTFLRHSNSMIDGLKPATVVAHAGGLVGGAGLSIFTTIGGANLLLNKVYSEDPNKALFTIASLGVYAITNVGSFVYERIRNVKEDLTDKHNKKQGGLESAL